MGKIIEKILQIVLNSVPVILMIGLVPLIKNEYSLALVYGLIIAAAFLTKYESRDIIFFLFGLIAMTVSEYVFVSSGAETFNSNALFGVMPLWLPLLWAYSFV